MTLSERLGQRQRNLGLGLHHFGPHLLDLRLHLLLVSDGHSAFFFGAGLSHTLVGIGLMRLEVRTDVFPNVHVGYIDRENLEGGAGVEPLCENRLGDRIRVLENFFVRVG